MPMARYYYNTGYLFGQREFVVTDRAAEVEGSGGSDFDIIYDPDPPVAR